MIVIYIIILISFSFIGEGLGENIIKFEPIGRQPTIYYFESFEKSYGQWKPDNDTSTYWEIKRTHILGHIGTSSIKMAMSGKHDDGTVWIEKPFVVPTNSDIQIDIIFYVFSTFPSGYNNWGVMAYAGVINPETEEDLSKVGHTNPQQVRRWAQYNHSISIKTGPNNIIWVAVGINVLWENLGYYSIDDIIVTITSSNEIDPGQGTIVSNTLNQEDNEDLLKNSNRYEQEDTIINKITSWAITIFCLTGTIILVSLVYLKRKILLN